MNVRVAGRKHATVLFADVVGSTSLGERLDPETVQQIDSSSTAPV